MNERPLHTFRGFNMKVTGEPPRPTHVPQRPAWTCRVCGDEWPCNAARENLLAEKQDDPTGTAVLMWTYLESFIFDQGPGPLGDAFERFIAWTRPRGAA
ncbi:hypothetical protein ACQPZX_29365 [Actinoplanes sp. CA-142083]|uniref:hypothetical protein n=1 Tax=Actinoplanes sp. CA-142083 TaxID=3239903 RepID=UPI003D94F074